MRAGKLPFKVEIQVATETRNSVGEVTKTWAAVEKVDAGIEPLRGEERLTQQQVKPAVDTKITIRGNAAPYLTPKHRIVHDDKIFDIDAIIDWQNRGIMKEINCKSQA